MFFLHERDISLKANMLWNAIGSAFFLACLWLITVLVVRLSNGYDAAGVLALGMAVSNIGAPIAQYKIRPYQVSDITGEFPPGLYIGHRIVTVSLSLPLMFAYGALTCAANTLPAVFLYCIYSVVAIVSDVLQGIEQQHDRLDMVGASYILRGIAALVGFIVPMLATGSLELAFIIMTSLSALCIVAFEIPCVRFLEPHCTVSFDKQLLLKLFKICFPAVIAAVFASAIPTVPRQVLGAVAGIDVLGGYASIAAPVLIIQMGATYVYAPLLKRIAELHRNADSHSLYLLFAKTVGAIIAIGAFSVLAFAVFAEPLFTLLFGAGIAEFLTFLYPLILCTLLTAFMWFMGDALIAMRDIRGNFLAFLIAFAISCALSYPLAVHFGGNGTSFAISIGLTAGIAFAAIRVVRILHRGSAPEPNDHEAKEEENR